MRAVPPELDPLVVARIDDRLATVEAEQHVRVAWAIESGSRAWGFPSPDSDYDCRFIYISPVERYLSLWPRRDVIETPLDKVLDVNGWDLSKAIALITKGNATAIEWLRSPIVYAGDATFRDDMLAFADEVVERVHVGRHYLHVARQQQAGAATLKRFFYVLRTATALRWLHEHPEESVPPMKLQALLDESAVGPGIRNAALDLIAKKALTRELGAGSPPPVLEAFVAGELERAEHFDSDPVARPAEELRALADAFFRAAITEPADL
ncbi:nucleotidyltransferase domain-containing protein [Gryllotalpicola koreensis]|uniref:Nucleotidyltransferase domain-containing protein n=1 Tax=Gryllotalpicola koreensis TaxID=993086 RepID=A0ABP7ZXF2_9MICO